MWEKCIEIELKVAHYQDLAARIQDQLTLDGIARLIAEAIARKPLATLAPPSIYFFRMIDGSI